MITIWQKEAELGDAHAQFSLGSRYVAGHEVPQDIAMALSWFRKAAEQGHVNAQLAVADIILRLPGFPELEAEGIKWLRAAAPKLILLAEGGDDSAITELIKIYSGTYAQTSDLIETVAWLKVVGVLGDKDANRLLAEIEGKLNDAQVVQANKLASDRLAKIGRRT